jgi:tRNA nucleotidyltransferase/poly(A) polymerase
MDEQVVSWLAQQDIRTFVVGGTVRDRLLGRPIYDLDLAVPGDGLLLARRLADRFQGAYYPLDEERSTGRAILPGAEGQQLIVDVARFRGADPDQRPTVEQGLATDLDDRDFTINALAADVRALDDVIDRHGGLKDLAAGLIRPVSEHSILDDPLRAVRAVRLAASLDFSLAPETRALIRRDGGALAGVSGERVRDELARLLAQPQAAGHLVQLDKLDLLAVIFPELEPLRSTTQSPPHHLDALDHSLETVQGLETVLGGLDSLDGPSSPASNLQLGPLAPFSGRLLAHVSQKLSEERSRLVTLKLAALMHDTGKPGTRSVEAGGRIRFIGHETESASISAEALRRLRFSKAEVRLASTVIRHHSRPLQLAGQESVSARAVYRFFRDTGEAGVDVLLHALADHQAKGSLSAGDDTWSCLVSLTARMLADYYERPREKVDPPLLLDGNDLMREFGLSPGPQIGELLELVREAQVSGEVQTHQEALSLAGSYQAVAH